LRLRLFVVISVTMESLTLCPAIVFINEKRVFHT